MAVPKDYVVYIEKGTNVTRAALNWPAREDLAGLIKKEGHKIIGYVSSGSETEAVKYGDTVLR